MQQYQSFYSSCILIQMEVYQARKRKWSNVQCSKRNRVFGVQSENLIPSVGIDIIVFSASFQLSTLSEVAVGGFRFHWEECVGGWREGGDFCFKSQPGWGLASHCVACPFIWNINVYCFIGPMPIHNKLCSTNKYRGLVCAIAIAQRAACK